MDSCGSIRCFQFFVPRWLDIHPLYDDQLILYWVSWPPRWRDYVSKVIMRFTTWFSVWIPRCLCGTGQESSIYTLNFRVSQIWDWHTCCHRGSLPISQHVSTCENRSKSGWSTFALVQANEPSSMWAVTDPLLVLKPLFCWCHFHAQQYGDVLVSAGCPGHTRHFPDCTPHFGRSCHTRHRITHHMASYHIIVPLLQLTSPILDAPKGSRAKARKSRGDLVIW